MKVRITDTDLDGKPLQGEGEIFAGKTALEVVRPCGSDALLRSDDDEDYLDMLLRNAKKLSGIDLIVKGDTPEEKADSLLASLVDHGLAEFVDKDTPAPIPIPAAVWQGLESVRRSGLTNMLDRRGHQDRGGARLPGDGALDRSPPRAVLRRAVQGIRRRPGGGKALMCGQAGIILGQKRRRAEERDYLAWLFTELLVMSEKRGPHATGVVWLNRDGDHQLFKRPVPASRFVSDKAFHEVLAGVDNRHHARARPHPLAHAGR